MARLALTSSNECLSLELGGGGLKLSFFFAGMKVLLRFIIW